MGVVGRVNMSMLLIDVTELPAVEVGDEVVLIGSQGDHTITVASFSDAAGDLNYEMLVKLDVRIPRIVVD
jgi:alanine racemase